MKEQLIQIAAELGWEEVVPQRNPVMISFCQDYGMNPRVNVYFTTMTVSVQYKSGKASYHKDVTLEEFREILNNL